jgi:8-oxo-dGTP diphosphatase
MSHQTYVAGFLFDSTYEHVALIKKEKPAWQKGKLNGIGGKIEPGETSIDAMRREFREETGVDIQEWNQYIQLSGDEFAVEFFYAIGDPFLVQTTTEEVVNVYATGYLPQLDTIPNLQWLIPMAMTMEFESAGKFLMKEIPKVQVGN